MPINPVYVPILKGKEGEFSALEVLNADIKNLIIPVIEIPDVPYDYANDRPAKTLDEHIVAVTQRVAKCWQNAPIFLDLHWLANTEELTNGKIAFDAVLTDCIAKKILAIPVITRTTSNASLLAVTQYCKATGTGGCIRLTVEDFEEDIDLEAEIKKLLSAFEAIGIGSVDLILDMEDLGQDSGRAVLIARSIFSMTPRVGWRRMILAATSFPEDLSELDAATFSTLPRLEWQLWKTLQKRASALPRPDLIFADYAIANPVIRELDPRTMRMSASIRYTTNDYWLVAKGRNVRQYGFDQYFELCKALIRRPEYSGRPFSWGDNYIADCADEVQGPGNATTWRKVGTNHHLTLVAKALANWDGI